MRLGVACHWQRYLVLAGLLALLVPGWAQSTRLPNEVVLNGVTLDSTFLEVLARRGMPHFIGPSVNGVQPLTDLLKPPAPEPRTPMTGPGAPGAPGMPVGYGGPGAPGAPGGYRAPGAPGYGAGGPGFPGQPTEPPKKEYGPYLIWRYEGNGKTPNPRAPITTYVFFNDQGVVEAVVVNLNDPRSTPDIRTESGITYGTRLTEIVKKYDWPEPFSRVGSLYYCNYPKYNVTFALDSASRKVMCIGIGAPFALVAQTSISTQVQTAAGTAPPVSPQVTLPILPVPTQPTLPVPTPPTGTQPPPGTGPMGIPQGGYNDDPYAN